MCEKICKNCVWYASLSHNFQVGKGFEKSHCCTAAYMEGFIVEVRPEDTCEEFFGKMDGPRLIKEYKK